MIVAASWVLLGLTGVIFVVVGVRSARRTWLTHHTPIEGIDHLEEGRPVVDELDAIALKAVNDVIDRGLKALDALDRKAAVILPALGVAAALALPHVNYARFDVSIIAAAGVCALLFGFLSFLAAAGVMYPRVYSAGVDPVGAALSTSDHPDAYKQGVINSLVRSADSIRRLVDDKGDLFIVSVAALLATILSLTIFGVNGGFTNGTY